MPPDTTVTLRLDHLQTLMGDHGLFEHARHDRPRVAHGYTTDDNARALVVFARAGWDEVPAATAETVLRFVRNGRVSGGWHNRMSAGGEWLDRLGSSDAHGRAVWGLGEVVHAGGSNDSGVAATLLHGFDLESPSPRSNAYAVLGATAAARSSDDALQAAALSYLDRVAHRLPGPVPGSWRWPVDRLAWANARLPEALLAAGLTLSDRSLIDDGVSLLSWLVDVETTGDRFSFTPVGGRGPGDRGPAFDQQPIEAWAMADACARAARATGDDAWLRLVERAATWFLGNNDVGEALYDETTGAGFDGLMADGVNLNRGAESTLAALGALQTWQRSERGEFP